jgi:pimeloyl-ACP methyl ester carboxylesterase
MMNETRRFFLLSALAGLAGSASLAFAPTLAGAALPVHSATDVLRAVATAQPALSYHAAGPEDGRPIVLARGHGQGVDSFVEVATLLAAQGFQVLLPHLRAAPPATLGQDLIGFIDSLHMPEAVFIGMGQGSDAAAATVQARRSRVIGLVLAGGPATSTSVPTIALAPGATPPQIAEAAATLVRQGKWRT